MRHTLLALTSVLVLGCAGNGDRSPVYDAAKDGPGGGGSDAGAVVRLPTWQLEDVQPVSPRTGQTYGLETFGARVVVVTLVEGF